MQPFELQDSEKVNTKQPLFKDRQQTSPVSRSTALFLLIYFIVGSAILAFDRGAWDSVIKRILEFYDINKAEGGLIGSMLIAGFLTGTLASGICSQYVNSFKIIYLSMFLWVLSFLFMGVSYSYQSILIARFAVGFCEAPLATLAKPLINIVAPSQHKTKWLGMLIMPATIGGASGVFSGPAISNAFGSFLWIFRILAVAVAIWTIPPLFHWNDSCSAAELKNGSNAAELQEESSSSSSMSGSNEDNIHTETKWVHRACSLSKNKIFICLTLAGSAQHFTFGGLGYWAVQYLQETFDLEDQQAAIYIGSLTATLGLVAPLLGGVFLDRKVRSIPGEENKPLRLRTTLKWVTICGTAGFTFMIPCILTGKLYWVLLGFAVYIFVSVAGAPMQIRGVFTCVSDRHQTMAITIFSIVEFCLGNLLSPPIVGAIADSSSITFAFVCMFLWSGFGTVFWVCAWIYSHSQTGTIQDGFQRFNDSEALNSSTQPLEDKIDQDLNHQARV